ncbi:MULTISPECIES: NAD(P)-dependent oxidoreductase [Actinosynnema]|uniref:NAD(P)-dependent oxidoreductase n=1 Tax=Actinosynnema TaxID=40566 RepID=UPI0020A450D6|nr:NAD(P)-dependent oxidoreductase [Actinosynnema pretiosum]MCP2093088.1 2-hydroxy-3-oxopropionate reductase [Actinosynnema pretiosum]
MRHDPVSVLGMGAMGLPIARNLARAGFPVTVWNRTPGKDGPARALGATPAATPADAALPVVLTVLPDLPQVREVLLGGPPGRTGIPQQAGGPHGPDDPHGPGSAGRARPGGPRSAGGADPAGAPESNGNGSSPAAGGPLTTSGTGLLDGWRRAGTTNPLLVVMGTVSPGGVRELGAELAPLGVRVVDAPVSGGDVGAEAGTLSVMVGGHADDVLRLRPYLTALGTTVRHMGPLGAGQLTKAGNQVVVAATLAAISEALALTSKNGLDPELVLEALSGGLAGGRALEVKREKWLTGDYTPGGSAANQLKDLGFAMETARASGVPLPVTATVAQLYTAMCALGLDQADHSGVYQVYEHLSGLPSWSTHHGR